MTIFRRLGKLLPGRAAKPVRIVTDSTAELPAEIVQELDIVVVPLQVIFGETSFRDGIDLTGDAFFERLAASDELPTTSQPSVGEFQGAYEEIADQSGGILSIHLSSRFSGTVGTARSAAETFAGRVEIEVIDSGTASMAMGLAVIAAARAARSGADLASCTATVRSVLGRLRLAVALETLEYLRRGGRIGRATAFLGGLLRLRPILTIRDGEAFPLTRVRTRPKALEALLRICLADDEIEDAAVVHATTPDDAQALVEEVARRRPGLKAHVGQFGPVIGVHGGPGMLGLAVIVRERPDETANAEAREGAAGSATEEGP